MPTNSECRVVAVVVTYHSKEMTKLLQALSVQCDHVVVVDNGSPGESVAQLRRECAQTGAELIESEKNLGIAQAQNLGIERARELSADAVLLSDHDSIPADDMVALLVNALMDDPRIGAVGPLPQEDRDGGDQLVYIDSGWGPKRASKELLETSEIDVAFLIASGCLIRMETLDDVGLMRADFFIDHVDLEWSMRARNAGWRLLAIPQAVLWHSLGDEVVMLPRRAQPVHVHSPIRNYYILRNTVAIIGWNGLPTKWRIRYVWWAAKYVAFNSLLIDRLPERRKMLRHGLIDGLKGRFGAYSH